MSEYRIAVGDLTPALLAQVKVNCEVLDLTGYTNCRLTYTGRSSGYTQTVTCTFETPRTDGKVKYQWVDGDTDQADVYDYYFTIADPDGNDIVTPDSDADPEYENSFEIVTVPSTDYQTALSKLHRYLRILIGDTDEDVPDYSTAKLTDALATVVVMGKVLQEDGTPYELSGDGNAIVPKLTPSSDQYNYIRLILHAARLIVGPMRREAFAIRAFSQSIGAPEQLVQNLSNDIYEIENGDGVG